jgi:DNA helicase-2/ATP-dependent DNA helicase PcrA
MNAEQSAAILHHEGPCALLAVAGAGKTETLVRRVARMVSEGVRAKRILAVTFSKKAAAEMNTRLEKLGVTEARVGTWHSLCLEIVQKDRTPWREWEVDEKDRAQYLLKDVLGYKGMDWRGADVTAVRSFVGHCKARLAAPGSLEAVEVAAGIFPDPREARLACEAFARYQRAVEEAGILPFDDFLVHAYDWLTRSEENRQRWAARWGFVLVDEAQDNNLAQRRLQHLLARDHRNIMLVGDTAQAIYSFRGSTPQHLAEFKDEWGGATEIVMNRNYRSGRAIIERANRVIGPAKFRLPLDMVAERDVAGSVAVRDCVDQDAEGEEFATWVRELVASGAAYSDVTALVRTNAQSRALEEALLKAQVPYVVVGGTTFYERAEVKSLLGYLRVALGRDQDGEGLRRSINAPFRFLGKMFVAKVEEAAGATWVERVRNAAARAGVQARQRGSAEEWARLVAGVEASAARGERPGTVLGDLVRRTGYVEWLAREQGEESVETSHAANVREMVRIAERFETCAALLDYVEEMGSRAREQRKDGQAGGQRVTLMSIHRSKGLEFPHVWVCGLNDMVLPHARGDIEEERRLVYVAVTRARDSLVLSFVRRFARPEGVREARPSVFLRDMGFVDDEGRVVGTVGVSRETTQEEVDPLDPPEVVGGAPGDDEGAVAPRISPRLLEPYRFEFVDQPKGPGLLVG